MYIVNRCARVFLHLPLNFTKSCAAHLYFRMSTKACSSRKLVRKRATSKRFDTAVGRRQRQSDDDHAASPADQPVLNAMASSQPPPISGNAAGRSLPRMHIRSSSMQSRNHMCRRQLSPQQSYRPSYHLRRSVSRPSHSPVSGQCRPPLVTT